MTLRLYALLALCALVSCKRARPVGETVAELKVDGFYVWQRDWRPAVRAAVSAEHGDLYLLAGEADIVDGTLRGEQVEVDWSACSDARSVTAVYRLHVNCLGHDATVSWLKQRLTALPAPIRQVQLDLDCPESRLDEYVELVEAVRTLRKITDLSVTVLPCHLNNRRFKVLANAVDWFVLQVHGIEPPTRIDDDCSLMRLSVAQSAIDRAKQLGRPFKVALPTYGYRLFFDSATGAFRRIAAENAVADTEGLVERVIAADLGVVATLVRDLSNDDSNCSGIIWFRLPVPGDALCISRRAVEELMTGRVPPRTITVERTLTDNGTMELFLRNDANLTSRKAQLHLAWAEGAGEFGLGRSFVSGGTILPGLLPSALIGRAPKPGERLLVGWFRTPSQNLVNALCKEIEQ